MVVNLFSRANMSVAFQPNPDLMFQEIFYGGLVGHSFLRPYVYATSAATPGSGRSSTDGACGWLLLAREAIMAAATRKMLQARSA